jgi:hypothetical protein
MKDKIIGLEIIVFVFSIGWILSYGFRSLMNTETIVTPAETPENPFVKVNREIRELMIYGTCNIALLPKDNLAGYQVVLTREQEGCDMVSVRLYRGLKKEEVDKGRELVLRGNFQGFYQFLDNSDFERIEFIDGGGNGFTTAPTDILKIRPQGSEQDIFVNGSDIGTLLLEKINTVYWETLFKVRQSILEGNVPAIETPEQKTNRLSIAQKAIDGLQ